MKAKIIRQRIGYILLSPAIIISVIYFLGFLCYEIIGRPQLPNFIVGFIEYNLSAITNAENSGSSSLILGLFAIAGAYLLKEDA